MYFNYLKDIFDFKKIDFHLWLLLFLSFFLPFVFRLVPFHPNITSVLLYGILPLIIIVFIFKESPKKFGYSFGNKRKAIFYSVFFSIILTPIILLGYFFPDVNTYYTIQSITSFHSLFLLELNMGFIIFFWELFFRGFILFGLYKKIGNAALPVHAIPFALFHLGKPNIEVLASFFAAILLGQIAIKSNSFLPAFFIHWVINAQLYLVTNFY